MSTQICPKCKAGSFTWYLEEELELTTWGCSDCGYIAYEDESFERECSNCGKETESRLEDKEKKYWRCSTCNRITDYE